jgi:hypothetical protein
MSTGFRPLVVAALGCACLVVADACNRDLTEPRGPRTASPPVPGKPNFDVASSPATISATTSGPEPWHGQETNANPSPIATFPTATWYRVDANGLITMTPDPRFMPGQPTKTYGPAGNARFTWSYAGINTTVVIGNQTSDSTGNAYVQMSGSLLSADRPGYPMVVWGPAYCGTGYSDPCGRYTGPPTTFSFTRLDADLVLTADTTENVAPGSLVTFSWAASPAAVEGHAMPVVPDSMHWIPDPDTLGGESTEARADGTTECLSAYLPACKRKIVGNGTFSLTAWVNGKLVTKSVHIDALFLRLRAKNQYGGAGDTVRFTPRWSDGDTVPSVQGYAWTADTLPGRTTGCGAVASCLTTVYESGRMTVTVQRNGVTRTAKVHAVRVPCPTGDSLLDNPELRSNLAYNDLARTASTEPGNRFENGAYLFQNQYTGEYMGQVGIVNAATACSWNDTPYPPAPRWWQIVVRSHAHPYDIKTDSLPPGTKCGKRTLHVWEHPHYGPSPPDSSVARDGVPSFQVDADSIYMTDGEHPHKSWPQTLGSCQVLPPRVLNRIPGKIWLVPRSSGSKRPANPSNRRKPK